VLVGFKPYLKDHLVSFSALTLFIWSMTCKNPLRNDLKCVEWDVKLLHYYYCNNACCVLHASVVSCLSILCCRYES